MQSSPSAPSIKNGRIKEGMEYITSQLPQRSLTKQALKRLASALKKKSPPSSPQKTCGTSKPDVKKPPKKQVSFYGMVQIRATIGLHEMSPQERAAAWYRKHEYFMISNECVRLVGQLKRGKTIECSRGLGNRTIRDVNRRSAVDVVLDEQDRQALLGVVDDEYIAFLYHSASSNCLRWSNLVGLQDQKEAETVYLDESETPMSRLSGGGPSLTPPTKPKKNIFATTPPVRRNRNVGGLSVVEFVEEALLVSPCSPSSSPPPPFNGAKAA